MTLRRGNYQRNTPSGRAVDTGPPRTNTGLTGLGAVGGPVGVGAGALRVIVEFLTQYDAEELKRLEKELDQLQKTETRHNSRIEKFRKEQTRSQTALRRVENIRQRADLEFTRAQRKEILAIRDLERSEARGAKARANAQKTFLAQQTGFRKSEISQLVNQDRIARRAQEQRLLFATKIRGEETKIAQVQQRQVVTQQRAGRLQQLRAGVLPRLGALGLGALGGIFGGAVVGLGFAAAQALLDAIGQALKDIIDPANKARDALKGVAENVNKIADQKGISLLEAAKKQLEEMGDAAADVDPKLLAAAAALQSYIEKNEELVAVLEVLRHQETLTEEAIAKRATLLAEQRGLGRPFLEGNFRALAGGASFEQVFGDTAENRILFEIYEEALRQLTSESTEAADAQRVLAAAERDAAQAAAFGSVAANSLANSISRIGNMRISGLQDQLAALSNTGPSARTQGLQAQLEGMQEAQAQAAVGQQLANIAQERANILLEKRIRFQGESVRLDQLSAEGQLIAIDARIEALGRANELDQERLSILDSQIQKMRRADQEQDKRDQQALEVFDERIAAIRKQGDEQDRLNQLLDLQYRMGQDINRQQGESIGDFIARRANEQRQLLAEQASLRREDTINLIQGERDKLAAQQEVANQRRESAIEAKELEREQLQATIDRVQKARQAEIRALQDRRGELELEVRLQKLAEQEKQIAAQETARQRTKALQDELRASQEADQKALESRREALQAQIDAEREKWEQINFWTAQGNTTQLMMAVMGANSAADLALIAGELQGASRVLGELRALVRAGVLEPAMVSGRIAALVGIIRTAEAKASQFSRMQFEADPLRAASGRGARHAPLQHGGVFMLNNAMNNPFGANIRTGEAGQEIGVVLSNRVTQALRENRQPVGNSTIIVNRSPDPYRDSQRFRKAARDAIQEVIR